MDDIALNPDLYDLFSEPALLALTAAWLLALALLQGFAPRISRVLLIAGGVLVSLSAADPVLSYLGSEVRLLRTQTATLRVNRSADFLRARDPLFELLTEFRGRAGNEPLAVVDDKPGGDLYRWTAYYQHPITVYAATPALLARSIAADGKPRYALTQGAPAFPADLNLSMEARHGDWILFRVEKQVRP